MAHVRASGVGLGKNHTGSGGKGLGKSTAKRHRKILRDNIQGTTKGSIRRMARRGGVKRISAGIYDEVRSVNKKRLHEVLFQITAILDSSSSRKTVTVPDVVFVLNRLGTPIYDFQAPFRSRT